MTLSSSVTTAYGLMAGLQPSSELSRAAASGAACDGSSASAAALGGAPCWSASAGGGGGGGSSSSAVAASNCGRGSAARPAAARWTELHLVSQHAPHAAHQQLPPHPVVDQVKAVDPQRQDFEFPRPSPSAAARVAQPAGLQYGRRSFDIAAHSTQIQQLRARGAGSSNTNTSGAFPAVLVGGTPAFPDHAAALGARHSFAHATGRREGDGDREWGQGHSQRLRGGTSCQLPEAVAALLRQLLHLDASTGGSVTSTGGSVTSTAAAAAGSGIGSAPPTDAGRGLSHGAAAASTGNCSCASDFSADAAATTAGCSSRARSIIAGACGSGVLGSCASIGLSSSGVSDFVEALCSRAASGSGSAGNGTSDAAAASSAAKPERAPTAFQACALSAAEAPAATASATTEPAPSTQQPAVAAAVAAAAQLGAPPPPLPPPGLSAVATCPISHVYRLFGRAGDPVLHLRLPGVPPAVLAAAAALSAESRHWALARLPPGAEGTPSEAAAGLAPRQKSTQQQQRRRRQPAFLVATTLADGCEEEGIGGAAGVDVAVMNFTAATLAMDAAGLPAAMAESLTSAPPPSPPPLTLTLARPPAAAFPLKATEEAGPGPDGGVDVSAFHVYASDDGRQVLLLLVVERPPLMPMLVSPRRLEQPRSVTLPMRSGASASSSSAVMAAAVVAGSATRSWGHLRRQVAPALLRASDAGAAATAAATVSGSSSVASLEAVAASGGRPPLPLPLPLPLPHPSTDDDPVPSCCRRLLNSSSFTVWAEHAAQSVPAAAAGVAVPFVGECAGGDAAWDTGRSAVAPAAARGEGEAVAEPPATPIMGAPRGLAPDSAGKSNSGATSSCKLHLSVASEPLLSRLVPAAQPACRPPAANPLLIEDCAAHLLMTVTGPKCPTATAAAAAAAAAASKPVEEAHPVDIAADGGAAIGSTARRSIDSNSSGGASGSGSGSHVHRADGCCGAGVAGGTAEVACAAADAVPRAQDSSRDVDGGGAMAAAVAVIPWAAFVSGGRPSGAAPYPLAVPPSPFSPRPSRSSSSSFSASSTSASSATASASAVVVSPSLPCRSSSSTSPPASASRLRRRRRQLRRREREYQHEQEQEGEEGPMRGLHPAFYPPSLSLSAIPSGAFTSEELFQLSMPSHASGALPGFSGHEAFSSGGAARFSGTVCAADAAAAVAAETTAGWLLAGQPVSFPYAASPSTASGSTSSSSSSSSPSSSRSSPCSSSDEGELSPECGPDASQRAAAGRRAVAPPAAAAASPALPPQPRQLLNGEGAHRTTGVDEGRQSPAQRLEGVRASAGARTSMLPAACGSHPGVGLLAAGSPGSGTAAGVGLGRMSCCDAGSAGASATSASGRAAVSAADAARVARVRAGWRAREAEWTEREAAWRVTESRWWQQAGGGGLRGG